MNRIIRNAFVLLLIAAGTAMAAEPAATSHEGMEHPQPAAETAQPKPSDGNEMSTTMPRRPGMQEGKGMGMGMNCDKGEGKEGKHGGMGGMGCKGGMGGCGGQDAFTALATQDLLQTLQEMVRIQEQLAEGLKGTAKTRVQKDLAAIGQRLDKLQADLRQSLKKEMGGKGGHGGKGEHGGKGGH